MDAKILLAPFLTSGDYLNLGKAVATGYQACDEYMMSNVAMSNFMVGMDQRSRLISVFVEHSLSKLDEFFHEIKLNQARNCWHTRLHKNGLVLTTHFLGRGENHRNFSRKAINRTFLGHRNLDLFEPENLEPDINMQHGYCQILHAGFVTPKFAMLAIPTRDQTNIHASTELPLELVDKESVETVREEITIRLLSNAEEINEANEAS